MVTAPDGFGSRWQTVRGLRLHARRWDMARHYLATNAAAHNVAFRRVRTGAPGAEGQPGLLTPQGDDTYGC